MFKKFNSEDNVSSISAVKSSQARAIRKKVEDAYPFLQDKMDQIFPTKGSLTTAKCTDHVSIVLSEGRPVFFNHRDGPFYPTMRLLHKYPTMMPKVQVDMGAIPFVLNGSQIMCAGFTSEGGFLPESLEEGSGVAVFAENKTLPLAIGLMKMSAAQIREVNKGIGVEPIHFLDDALWQYGQLDCEQRGGGGVG